MLITNLWDSSRHNLKYGLLKLTIRNSKSVVFIIHNEINSYSLIKY